MSPVESPPRPRDESVGSEPAERGEESSLPRRIAVLADALRRTREELEKRDQAVARLAAGQESGLRSLAAFRRIAESLGGKFAVQEICDVVCRTIVEELGVEHASVMLLAASGLTLRIAAGASHDPLPPGVSPALDREFRVGEGVAGEVALRAETILIEDVERDPRWLQAETRVQVRSLLCVPLTGGARLIGVLNMSHSRPRFFAEAHLRVFSILCPIVAQLIAFALTQEELRQLNQALEEEVRRRVSDLRETQAGLARREKLAALGETVSGLAHELNNRLLPITMYADSLLDGRLPARQAKQVTAIAQAAAGVRGIVESLLGFARRKKPRKVATDLNDVLDGTVAVVKFGLQRDGILVKTGFDRTLPRIMADPLQVEQVALNLIKNAQDAVRARGDGASGLIQVSTERSGEWALVRVRDNGCGIPPQHLAKILEPFFTTKAPGEGTGLGLALSYGIMTEHGGDIQVESRLGDTAFTLRFPLAHAGSEGDAPLAAAGEAGEIPRDARILVVDDDAAILDLMHDVLDGRLAVDTAASGVEAIRKLAQGEYDVVLSDMRMPGLGGREIYRWLRENRPGHEARVVFSTGDTWDPSVFEFVHETGVCCIAKPFTLKAVLGAIRTILAQRG